MIQVIDAITAYEHYQPTRRQAEERAYNDARDFPHLPPKVLDALERHDASLPPYSHDFSDVRQFLAGRLPLMDMEP